MRDDPVNFKLDNEASEKSPRFVISIEFEVESIYLTSHAGISNVPGVVIEDVLIDHSAISQRIVPDEARSEIGSLSFELADIGSAFTDEVKAKLADGAGLRGKTVRLYIGYSSNFDDYELFQTQVVQSAQYDEGTYRVSCQDITREQRKEIFEPKRTTLRASVDADDTTIPVYVTTGFERVPHGTSYSDAPSLLVGYIKLGDEIIRYTGTTSDSFTGCTRGVLNTRAVSHDVDSGSSSDRRPRVEEYVYLELPAPKLAYAILTGEIYTGSTLPSHWNLGISADLVRVSDFTGIGIDLWNTSADTDGVILRFTGPNKVDGKRFLESEIYPLIGCYSPVYSDGTIGLKKMNQVLADAASVVELNETNCVSWSALDHDMDGFFNAIRIDWNFVGDEYTRTTVFVDQDSTAVHGATPIKALKFQGLYGSRHTDAIIRQRIDALRDRYTHPPERMSVDVLPSLNRFEVGDIVRVKLPTVRDFAGAGSFIDRAFEIQRKNESQINGKVSLDLFGSTGRASVRDPSDDGANGGGGAGTALPDAYYTAVGTNLTSVCTINVVGGVGVIQAGTYNLTGNADLNATGAIYYYNGDLELSSGATLTINNNVQLRVKGFCTFNGTISGAGRGKSGQADTSGDGTNVLGLSGFIGNSRGMDGWRGDITGFLDITAETVPVPLTAGLNSSFPFLQLSVSGNNLTGLPSDLRGTSGGSGGKAYPISSSLSVGGTGGNSGAGLAIICRGFAFGGSGQINLSGASSSATSLVGPAFMNGYPGAGGAGSPGGFFLGLDGSSLSLPDLSGRFIAATGSVPVLGTPISSRKVKHRENIPLPLAGYLDESVISSFDMSNAAHRIQYIPGAQTPEEDQELSPPPPYGATVRQTVAANHIEWISPPEEMYDVVEVYASLDNNRSNAVLVGEVRGTFFAHYLPLGGLRYYWIRARKRIGEERRYSKFHPDSTSTTLTAFAVTRDDPTLQRLCPDGEFALATDATFWTGIGIPPLSIVGSGGSTGGYLKWTADGTNPSVRPKRTPLFASQPGKNISMVMRWRRRGSLTGSNMAIRMFGMSILNDATAGQTTGIQSFPISNSVADLTWQTLDWVTPMQETIISTVLYPYFSPGFDIVNLGTGDIIEIDSFDAFLAPPTFHHSVPTPGLVPAPTTSVGKFLRDDAQWQTVTLSASKASSTSRSSTTTLADDPDLVIAIPEAGLYACEAMLFYYTSTTATAGFKFSPTFSGSAGSAGSPGTWWYTANAAMVQPINSYSVLGQFQSATPISVGGSTSWEVAMLKFVVDAATAGNLKIQWAQNSSSASSTTLRAGSYLKVERVNPAALSS